MANSVAERICAKCAKCAKGKNKIWIRLILLDGFQNKDIHGLGNNL
jgi:hypothetical protein